MLPPSVTVIPALVRTKARAQATLARHRPPRTVAGEAPLLHQHGYAGEGPAALEGHVAKRILLLIGVLQTDEVVVVGADSAGYDQPDRQVVVVIVHHLAAVFGGIVAVIFSVLEVVVQIE